jgi:hypothetical protein
MPDAEKLAAASAAAKEKADKPLPELRSPMTRLPDEIRVIIAKYCRDTGVSFSSHTVVLWIAELKKLKLIAQDLKIDLAPRRGGGAAFKEKETAYVDEIAKLKQQLADAKAGKS